METDALKKLNLKNEFFVGIQPDVKAIQSMGTEQMHTCIQQRWEPLVQKRLEDMEAKNTDTRHRMGRIDSKFLEEKRRLVQERQTFMRLRLALQTVMQLAAAALHYSWLSKSARISSSAASHLRPDGARAFWMIDLHLLLISLSLRLGMYFFRIWAHFVPISITPSQIC